MITDNNSFKTILAMACALSLMSCTSVEKEDGLPSVLINAHATQSNQDAEPSETTAQNGAPDVGGNAKATVYPGTGKFIAEPLKIPPHAEQNEQGDVTLNFHDTDIHEVIKVIMGDVLGLNYIVDPKVKGSVSLQTSKPITRNDVLPMLESILQVNGLALVEGSESYRILPYNEAAAASTPRVGRRTGPGFSIRVIPLSYISAEEMQKILAPVVAKEAFVRVDDKRNLLMLAGTSQELNSWLETIRLFDVDWLQGQSVALFPLNNSDAADIIEELKMILGASTDGVSAELVKIQPLERLNALLVVTSRPHYLAIIRKWIERLDLTGNSPGRGLYVYKVKNRKAADLADIISQILVPNSKEAKPKPKLAPGMQAVTLKSNSDKTKETKAETPPPPGGDQINLPKGDADIRVVADEQKNAILVMASAEEYRIIESALKRLDTLPLQVIIEVSIVDVILTDDLKYGVEWYFENGVGGNKIGAAELNFGNAVAVGATGFSYSVIDSANVIRAVLNALAEESKINVISSPSLMVLDNNTAEIQVGNQQPVRTATAQTDAGTILESIEFKDTGVKLKVTPSVNPGGLVTMEVSQEVTDVGEIDSATKQRSFLKRLVNSTVAVKTGQTIVLGGLITENNTVSESGIPGLYKLPVFGKLFGNTTNSNKRNELLILLTPSVVEKPTDAAAVLDEYRKSMKSLKREWIFKE